MTDMREEFECIAKESHQIINFSRYEDYLIAAEYGREVGDYCVPFVRDLWQGYQMAIAARTGGEVEAIAKHIENKADAIAEEHGRHEPDTNAFVFDSADHEDDYNLLTELAEDIREGFADGCPSPATAVPDGMDRPWHLRACVEKLCEAADILLDDKCYDGLGWELIGHARDNARALLTAAPQPVGESETATRLIAIVEGIDNLEHGTFRGEKSGTRLKDTPQWVEFYNYVKASAQPPEGER